MREDLEILKSLYYSELTKILSNSSGIKVNIDEQSFWNYFNELLFSNNSYDSSERVLDSLQIKKSRQILIHFNQLRNEYISYLASTYCAGGTNPTIEFLSTVKFPPFLEEIDFQHNLKKAITISERSRLKKKLALIGNAENFDITSEEINSAFIQLEGAKRNSIIRSPHGGRHKRWKTIPLIFLKFAAAACITTASIWGGIKIYQSTRIHKNSFNVGSAIPSSQNTPNNGVLIDTSRIKNTFSKNSNIARKYKTPRRHDDYGIDTSVEEPNPKIVGNKKYGPKILLRGKVVDFVSKSVLKDMKIKMVDENGNTYSYDSEDGYFSFKLSVNHDYTITGEKIGYNYTSAHLSLSTKGIQLTDPDDTVNVTLHVRTSR